MYISWFRKACLELNFNDGRIAKETNEPINISTFWLKCRRRTADQCVKASPFSAKLYVLSEWRPLPALGNTYLLAILQSRQVDAGGNDNAAVALNTNDMMPRTDG